MILHVFKQMWNNRRHNGWIVAELIVVTYFMWGVIDPVYMMLSNRTIPDGFDVSKMVIVRLYSNILPWNKTPEDIEREEQTQENVANMIEALPEVEQLAPNIGIPIPLFSSATGRLQRDTISEPLTLSMLNFRTGDETFEMLQIRDARTGEIMRSDVSDARSIYISADAAKIFFPELVDCVGQTLLRSSGVNTFDSLRVAGVFASIKMEASSIQPIPVMYMLNAPSVSVGFYNTFFIRLRDDVSAAAFVEKFKTDIASQLPLGDIYRFDGIINLEKHWKDREVMSGTTNKLRLHIGMMLFFLLCVFLGVAGTFLLRAKARRGEIGLRKALGGSRRRILAEFLTESGWLVTIAWLVGILIVYNRVHVTGFAEAPEFLNDTYLQNRMAPHFWIVSGIVYVLTLSIAFVGTWFPARQAACTDAAEALRDDT
ncbi:MAG: ABC transporter permease [Prevotellaceae bacterium]|jgi:hypothetical protein|nr:ABC transporter permease [Prevotellaceae bacterium]